MRFVISEKKTQPISSVFMQMSLSEKNKYLSKTTLLIQISIKPRLKKTLKNLNESRGYK